jgi:hypothetical protein
MHLLPYLDSNGTDIQKNQLLLYIDSISEYISTNYNINIDFKVLLWSFISFNIVITIITFLFKHEKKLIIIPNRTELIVMGAMVFLPIITAIVYYYGFFALNNTKILNLFIIITSLSFIIPYLIMIKSTYLYNNRSIIKSFLSIYVKTLFSLIFVLIFVSAFSYISRKQGETSRDHERRSRRTKRRRLAYAFAFLAVFVTLAIEKNISVSFKDYFRGINY